MAEAEIHKMAAAIAGIYQPIADTTALTPADARELSLP